MPSGMPEIACTGGEPGGDCNALGGGGGLGEGKTVFAETGEVKSNSLANQVLSVFAGIANDTKAGNIGSVGPSAAVVSAFKNHQIFAHRTT
jgi:hypothetical protein